MGLGSRSSAIGLIACIAACTGLDGLSGGDDSVVPPPPQDDAGRDNPCAKSLDDDHDNCGACGTVCGGMEHCLAGKCAPGCPDHTVYVSADGNDNASGCTTTTPKRTIGAGIALLKTLAAQKHEIHVCRGQYDESVVLDYATSILGAYECSTWKRSATYGGPTFDGVNDSVINGAPGQSPLTIKSIQDVTVDGLTLRARDGAAIRIPAVKLNGQAKAKLVSVKLIGGGGMVADSPASVGLQVDEGAFADVLTSSLRAGGATNTTAGGYGSAGIFITAKGGGVHVADSDVDGGGGRVSSGTGSVGILALGASLASTIERSTINGGTGHTSFGSGAYGIGYFASSTPEVAITSNTITGGSASCGGTCGMTGLSVTASGKITVTGNRITGGEGKPDVADAISFSGMRLRDYATADVQNNFVFSGNTKRTFSDLAETFEIDGGMTAFVANNTFALGPSRAQKGTVVTAKSMSATFVNNLFLDAAIDATDTAAKLDGCAGRTYAMKNNVWVGFPDGGALLALAQGMGCPPTPPVDVRVDTLESRLTTAYGVGSAAGNTRLSNGCSGDAACTGTVACATTTGCIGTVLTGWDPLTAGGLLASGWKLGGTVACGISKGAVAAPGLLMTDGFGAPRTDPRSIGAHEQDGTCQ